VFQTEKRRDKRTEGRQCYTNIALCMASRMDALQKCWSRQTWIQLCKQKSISAEARRWTWRCSTPSNPLPSRRLSKYPALTIKTATNIRPTKSSNLHGNPYTVRLWCAAGRTRKRTSRNQ